jgi:hypothetical protein
MALIWSAWAAAWRAIGLFRTSQTTLHPVRPVDEVEPSQFVDTEATWWSD